MALIIKDKIRMLMNGYPTVSDKYNVAGGILTGSTPVQFGELVIRDSDTANGCYYKAITTTFTKAALGGFVLATNVKLAQDFPGTTVQVNPGEAFNLALPGTFMAIKLGYGANTSNIVANKAVATFLSGDNVGELTTTGASSSDGTPVTATDLDNVVFTGVYENIGTAMSPVYVAEILIK